MKRYTPTKIIIAGAAGKMGRTLLSMALQDKSLEVVGAFEDPRHPAVLEDIGLLAGGRTRGIAVSESLEGIIKKTHVVIDFTTPKATLKNLKVCARHRKAIVIGTTGFSKKEEAQIERYKRRIPIVKAPNMSLGVNLMFKLAFLMSASLNPEYDVEIVEAHHREKIDAPSGTAYELARRVAEGRKIDLSSYSIYGRRGMTGPRKAGTIGMHAIRGGDVVGEHTVSFMADGERIELTHRASSRGAFARGALFATHYLRKRSPGLYNMAQVLAL